MNLILLVVLTACASWLLTGLLRRYALAKSLLDIPNERSSHSVPTPRGGGVAIVISFLAGLALVDDVPASVLVALFGAGAWVALVGFLDDHGHIAARWRLMAHFFAAAWALAWLGGMPAVPVNGTALDLGWAGHVLGAIYLVWLLNLYNFMDGIDGIAGIEALTVCLGAVVVYTLAVPGVSPSIAPLAWLLAAAVLGFFVWNYPPAKIFMGDAGSGFLGLMVGLLSIQAAWTEPRLFWCWVILLGVFVVDATVTLMRRIMRGDKFYQAHRSHAYQYASRKFGAHRPVSLAVGVVNLVWLLPLAVLVGLERLGGVMGVMIAYVPLLLLAIAYKAGASEAQEI
jgi:Fuc2NAc and GlcNAc transferase